MEVMGSEGYLINQFLVSKTNKRTDQWGGSYENRMRLAIECVKAVRKACGEDFIIIYRLSMLDLVEGGETYLISGNFCFFYLQLINDWNIR